MRLMASPDSGADPADPRGERRLQIQSATPVGPLSRSRLPNPSRLVHVSTPPPSPAEVLHPHRSFNLICSYIVTIKWYLRKSEENRWPMDSTRCLMKVKRNTDSPMIFERREISQAFRTAGRLIESCYIHDVRPLRLHILLACVRKGA